MESLSTRFRNGVFLPYRDLLKAQYRFHPKFGYVGKMWEEKLTEKEIINGPYLEKSQIYERGESLDSLPLHEETRKTLREKLKGRELYKHQTDALKLLLNGKNAVIATGTSSGKTLCYQIPILNDLIQDPSTGLRAIIIYPLNALVNDQLKDWEDLLKKHKEIYFARFTGQTPNSQKDYENKLKDIFEEQLADRQLTEQGKQKEINSLLEEQLQKDKEETPNRLNHREDIRKKPPHILITNFSMLEYLLERPVDAPIFENSRLKFLVLDEAHAYRGVQATEIAFLIRRLKDRLGVGDLTCIATSATLGKQDKDNSLKVRKFASDLFGEEFSESNPIFGTSARPQIEKPSFKPLPDQYIKAAEALRINECANIQGIFGANSSNVHFTSFLNQDENLYQLRDEILSKPILLSEAAQKLWANDPKSEDGLQALLEIVAIAKKDESHDDLLPTRLHYFIKAQDGLHVCLDKQCPGRHNDRPAFFVSRKNNSDTPEGHCPECYQVGRISKLIEVVSCRKCGYLFGALQDLGPRRAQDLESDVKSQEHYYFDSFSTELGWAADSFWSYFSIEGDLPFPDQPKIEEDEDDLDDLFIHPFELKWCSICGKKRDNGAGDNCKCENPQLHNISIFHRQCPTFGKAKDYDNLFNPEKKLLHRCPNCGARNTSGLEPLRRFQESEDETGIAMAIPLAHFQVTPHNRLSPVRKLLCFTDHRQRAAAFPSLLEEETFAHDMGRMILKVVSHEPEPIDILTLGEQLADIADPQSNNFDPDFFMPISRFPDEKLNFKEKRNLWVAETLSYFGIPDSARESAEDLGLVAVRYEIKENQAVEFYTILQPYGITLQESKDLLQVLLGFIRQKKAFSLPKGVEPDAPAFGRVTASIGYVLRRDRIKNTIGWLPHLNKDDSYRDNLITDYLRRVLNLPKENIVKIAENIWEFLISEVLVEGKGTVRGAWQLDYERLRILKPKSRYVCSRCRINTAYSVHQCCPHKGCDGLLKVQSFNPSQENIIAHWVADTNKIRFTTLKSEEHTAQINKDLAKKIEEDFRAPEGVNLLSSTTTFELGINIGDLQKVLLRNAPPTSASYVQRVGRAGRGNDKNSICVTLCRRTKYDADMWNNPARLMSGEIRTPVVFLDNRIISQRHFNAVVFAKFLRNKLVDEHVLGKVTQLIRVEAFIPPDIRKRVPISWHTTDVYLDFADWLKQENINDTARESLFQSYTSKFRAEIDETIKAYKDSLSEITEELNTLLLERQKLTELGLDPKNVEQAIKNILNNDIINVLSKRGFLPRYAFPLDVVTLETGHSRWSRETDVELSRDRGIAIAEFAPGAQVIAHKKVFTSAGLYVVSRIDIPVIRWYSKCRGCGQIRTAPTKDELKGKCDVCKQLIISQDIMSFVEPVAFSSRIDKRRESSARHRRSTLIRQRQALTHFIDVVPEDEFKNSGLFDIAIKIKGRLFRYNLGPRNKGFMLCRSCGCSEPAYGVKMDKRHKRLRALSGSMDCDKQFYPKPTAYGHEFKSFCLIARPVVLPKSEVVVKSLSFALQKGLCELLGIDTYDIGVSWRWLTNKRREPTDVEIILYDTTPGGAGFAKEGYDNWQQVVEKAREICETCICERACYDCLKNYSNQSHHEALDRESVIDFLNS